MSAYDAVAAEYDAARPDYPAELYDTLESVLGQPLLRAEVLDVGAGTGIATRALRGRGARVLAIDPSAPMLAALRRRSPATPVVRASGEALPVHTGRVDLVCYAQSFHWADPEFAVPEAVRVLRPRGVLATWWNLPDRSMPWWAAHEQRLATACPAYHGFPEPSATPLATYGLVVAQVRLPWARRVSLATYLTALRSHSYVAALGAPAADAFVAAEGARLADEAGPELDERFVTHLVAGRRPSAGPSR